MFSCASTVMARSRENNVQSKVHLARHLSSSSSESSDETSSDSDTASDSSSNQSQDITNKQIKDINKSSKQIKQHHFIKPVKIN